MEKFDLIVIGFGKAGKTLAAKMAIMGKKVALIEKNNEMFGGTCINIGCIPTKALIQAIENGQSFEKALNHKNTVVTRLREKNKLMILNHHVTLIEGHARFIGNKEIEINNEIKISADTIVINTGSSPIIPSIEGINETRNIVDSSGIQNLNSKPKTLGIIGAGVIGLEFANLYSNLGTKVVVFENSNQILSRYEPEIASLAQKYMEEDGIQFVFNSKIEKVNNHNDKVILKTDSKIFEFDIVLHATGRKANIENLGLENTDIKTNDRNFIIVDEFCETSVKGVYAVGDVNGISKFTYTSLDDFRIVFSKLISKSDYTLNNRKNIATSIFINPVLSQVGLTEKEAQEKGYQYKTNSLFVSNMPRAHVDNNLKGMFKVLVDSTTNQILGATLFSKNSHEIINIIKMAMDNRIPYTYLKNQLFTHPTMSENLNDVFNF